MKHLNHFHILLWLCLFIAEAPVAAFTDALDVVHQEVYFRYYPEQKYVHIKEYNLSWLTGTNVNKTVAELKKVVGNSAYCEKRYRFTYLQSIEEKIFPDKKNVTAECHLITAYENSSRVLTDLLERLLQRKVKVGITKNGLAAVFDGTDLKVADNNAKGVFKRKNTQQQMILWQPDKKYYEAVFTQQNWQTNTVSLLTKITKKIASPALTEKQVKELRKQLLDKVDKESERSIETVKKLAKQGNSEEQYALGMMYWSGVKSLTRDDVKAAKWLEKAAKQGHANAQNNLGFFYVKGIGVTKNYKKALSWFNKAARQGNAAGQASLAQMYTEGKGVKQDYTKARKWLNKSVAQGFPKAEYNLALMYEKGYGVKPDFAMAFKLLQKSAQHGYAEAQFNLGIKYARGKGISQDTNKAYFWFKKAAAKGNKNAKAILKELDARLKK